MGSLVRRAMDNKFHPVTGNRLLPVTHLDYFVRHLPKHTVIEQPEGFGHCPHIDAPGRLAHRIVAFARANVL